MNRGLLLILIGLSLVSFVRARNSAQSGDVHDNYLAKPNNDDQESSDSIRDDHQRHCDTDACDTIVTKCQQTNRCFCDFKRDPYCAKECVICLEEKFGKCCACVGLCPAQPLETHSSHVGDIALDKTYDELFEVLTEKDDIHGRWQVEHKTLGHLELKPDHGRRATAKSSGDNRNTEHDFDGRNATDVILSYEPVGTNRCTMAFINRYLNMLQCRKYCRSMGATRYRWFEDGCCECLGKSCTNYGIDKPKCDIEPYD